MTIALSCPSCDKALKVKDELAGKKVKCPGCGEPIVVEAADDPEPESAVQEPPRRKGRDDDDDRPRKKKKKKKKCNTLLWVALGGGAAVLLLLVVAGVILFFVFNQPAAATKTTEQAKKKQDQRPKFEPLPENKRPKGGIIRAMDVQEAKNAMKQIGLAYHNYVSTSGKAPLKMQDLMQHLERNALIEKMLTDGSVEFVYGVKPQDMTQGTSNTLLAWEKDADNLGRRVVLFADGSVDVLTEDDFQAKPRAQPRQ
jgi:uncharacterized Zn finger protein (UPF0148 family)